MDEIIKMQAICYADDVYLSDQKIKQRSKNSWKPARIEKTSCLNRQTQGVCFMSASISCSHGT